MQAINKFFVEIHKANKKFVLDAWEDWQVYLNETLKADVEKKYPDGFKDFVVEKFESEIIKAKAEK